MVDAGFEIQTPDPYVQGIETSVAVADRDVVSVSRTTDPGAEPWLVPLADRGALASFTVITTTVAYNGPDYTSGSCDAGGFSSWALSGSDVLYRELGGEYVISVLVRIPPDSSGADPSVVLLDDGVIAFTLPLASSIPC